MSNRKYQRQNAAGLVAVLTTCVWACSGQNGENKATSSAAPATPSTEQQAADPDQTAALIEQIGVAPGPVQHEDAELAVIAKANGKIEVRRLGREHFAPAKEREQLYQGDQVRTLDGASATILFPDESSVELAEVSTLSIGSRTASSDPASSAAVLSGVARFSVTPRAPGEGPFLAFTAAGVIATKGTVFGVGVAADGGARVGVELGVVEVAGGAAFDQPVTLEADHAVALNAAGEVASQAEWPKDDWGAWRDEADADLKVNAAVDAHADAMAALSTALEATYGAVAKLDEQMASFEAEASAAADANVPTQYEAKLPSAAVAIDASFLAALRLEYLTQAYASHAALAAELYVRHPDEVAWKPLAPRLQAAVLWPKRWAIASDAYFEPLRVQYYLHHARGRAHAKWVGLAVPMFYASVTPPEIPAVEIKKQLSFRPFTLPQVVFTASARPLWIAAPAAGWRSNVHFTVQAPRGEVAFWVHPAQLKAHALLGMELKHPMPGLFVEGKGNAHAAFKLKHKFHGPKIKVTAPDVRAAAQLRAKWGAPGALQTHGHLDGHASHERNGDAKVVAPGIKMKVAGPKLRIEAPKLQAPKVKVDANAKAKAKIKAPKLQAEAKASVGFKMGH